MPKDHENGHKNIFGLSFVLESNLCQKSMESFWIFFIEEYKREDQLLSLIYFDNFDFLSTLLSLVLNFGPILTSNSKRPKGQKYFIAVFIVLWPFLLTTKLSCLQKNQSGHTTIHQGIATICYHYMYV